MTTMATTDPNNFICSVCQLKLFNGEESNATPCGHIYHRQCIRYSIHRMPSCPICRQAVNRRDLVTLFFSEAFTNNQQQNATITTATPALAGPTAKMISWNNLGYFIDLKPKHHLYNCFLTHCSFRFSQ